jgi:hypothetical protein
MCLVKYHLMVTIGVASVQCPVTVAGSAHAAAVPILSDDFALFQQREQSPLKYVLNQILYNGQYRSRLCLVSSHCSRQCSCCSSPNIIR